MMDNRLNLTYTSFLIVAVRGACKALLALAVMALMATAALAAEQSAAAPPLLQLAQAAPAPAQDQSYLPPWERSRTDQDRAADPAAPQRISPPAQTAPAPQASTGRSDRLDTRPLASEERSRDDRYRDDRPLREPDRAAAEPRDDATYTMDEIVNAGHRFFGTVTDGLSRVVEYAFSRQGRPNGYILGEEAGGAFIAGLRYGEGILTTKFIDDQPVFWQGPSLGYDFGAEGSKTMILVYNLRHPDDIYHRFAGVDGSAYFVGGVGITFQRYGDVVLAPIRSGIGFRLGANVGYLKYSREPTWNPF
jgi:hypothetical protein